jgi:hypothetical protein
LQQPVTKDAVFILQEKWKRHAKWTPAIPLHFVPEAMTNNTTLPDFDAKFATTLSRLGEWPSDQTCAKNEQTEARKKEEVG